MQFLLGLVAGLIIGWIIEWIIDWQFWRVEPEPEASTPSSISGSDRLQADLAHARAQIAALEAQLSTAAPTSASSTSASSTSVSATQSVVGADDDVVDDVDVVGVDNLAAQPDDLTAIKGIGAVFARRLNDGGIVTFAQLAQATPDQLQDIVQAAEWQAIDPATWIAEARQLSAPGEGD